MMKFIYITLLTLTLAACGGITPYKPHITQGVVITDEMLENLQEGLHKQQIRQMLGPDYAKNPFQSSKWEYVYSSTNKQLHPDAINHLTLTFDQDDYLESWKIQNNPSLEEVKLR